MQADTTILEECVEAVAVGVGSILFGDDSYDDVDDNDWDGYWDQLNINLGWKFWSGNPTGPPWTNRGHTLLAIPSTFGPSLTGVFIWYLVITNTKYHPFHFRLLPHRCLISQRFE